MLKDIRLAKGIDKGGTASSRSACEMRADLICGHHPLDSHLSYSPTVFVELRCQGRDEIEGGQYVHAFSCLLQPETQWYKHE